MHWYDGVRDDFYEQMLSEIKIPSRLNPRKRAWKARTDRRNEALDCTVYALYLSRHLRLHLRRPGQWDLDELRLRQGELITLPPPAAVNPQNSPKPDPVVEPDEMVQTPVQAATDDESSQDSPQDDATELLAAQRAKQAWAAMMAQRKGARRG